jgi:hypothetical protein
MTTITSFAEIPEPPDPATDQLYHTVSGRDGRWQSFELIQGSVDAFVGASCAEVDGSLGLVGVGTDGALYHSQRRDGAWDPFVGLRDGVVDGGPREFYAAACSGARGALDLVGLGSDGRLYHAARDYEGRWQDRFDAIDAAGTRGPDAFAGAACAGIGDALHLIALDENGHLHHSVRDPDAGWQEMRGLSQLYDAPARFVAVDCAAVWGGSLHLVGVGSDAQLYHTIRFPDGSWQRYFGVLGGQQHGVAPSFALSVACARVGHSLGLVAICSDHRLFHSIRTPDGSWRGSLQTAAGYPLGAPPEFYDISCASIGNALHIVGGTWQGGFV